MRTRRHLDLDATCRLGVCIAAAVFLAMAAAACRKEAPVPARESVLDRVAFIEPSLVTEVPAVGPLCDEIELEKRRIDVGDGCELYVELEGRGTPLVLLHGGPGATHHYFHPAMSRAAKFARVVYYDQRGCGISDYEPGPGYTVAQAVEDLERLRQALGFEKWVVLGHSYGGYLAQRYTMAHPGSVAGLIILTGEPGLPGKYSGTRQYDYISDAERQRMQEIRRDFNAMLEDGRLDRERWLELVVYNNHLNGDWKRQSHYRPTLDELARMARFEWKQDAVFNSVMSRDIRRINLEGAFADCPIPTLIMESTLDLTWPPEKPQILLANHPAARMVMFEQSGHSPFADEPERFFAELKTFVKSLPPVGEAAIARWTEALTQWEIDGRDKFLTEPMGEAEARSIEEFGRIRADIGRGRRFEDASTPLRAFASFISAVHFRDKAALARLQPQAELSEEVLARLDAYWMSGMDILRAPLPLEHPAELEMWPVYLREASNAGASDPSDINLFIFWQGSWVRQGNMGGGMDWRPYAPLMKKSFQEAMGKRAATATTPGI